MGVSMKMEPQSQFVLESANEAFIFNEALDRSTIQTFYENDLNFCLNMFEVCLHTVPLDINNLMDAAHEHDYIAMVTIANKMKSNFGLVGMKEMHTILDSIEIYAKASSPIVLDLCSVFENKVEGKLALLKCEVLRIAKFLSSN